jgi:hypothetical protein
VKTQMRHVDFNEKMLPAARRLEWNFNGEFSLGLLPGSPAAARWLTERKSLPEVERDGTLGVL